MPMNLPGDLRPPTEKGPSDGERLFIQVSLVIFGFALVLVSVISAVGLGGMFYSMTKSKAIALTIGLWSYVCSSVIRTTILAFLRRWLLPGELSIPEEK
jgi:hypothetical protein